MIDHISYKSKTVFVFSILQGSASELMVFKDEIGRTREKKIHDGIYRKKRKYYRGPYLVWRTK